MVSGHSAQYKPNDPFDKVAKIMQKTTHVPTHWPSAAPTLSPAASTLDQFNAMLGHRLSTEKEQKTQQAKAVRKTWREHQWHGATPSPAPTIVPTPRTNLWIDAPKKKALSSFQAALLQELRNKPKPAPAPTARRDELTAPAPLQPASQPRSKLMKMEDLLQRCRNIGLDMTILS